MVKEESRQILERKAAARIELYRRAALKGDFWSYLLYMDFKFFNSRKEILRPIADTLQNVVDAYGEGRIARVAISLPPRSGKSWIITQLCAFMLGHHPEESIMRNTCTATLYKKLSKDTRAVIQSPKWQDLFNVKLKTKGVDTWSLEPARQTSYFGGGTGSTIIGFGASMLDISDDLYKNWEDAMSDDNNAKVLTWASAVRGSRVERGCCRIDIGTRWRTNDVIGVSERDGLYDYVISTPAMTPDNKSFCEAVQTTEHYLREKANVPEEVWSAEYMQQPLDIKGRLFAPADMEWFEEGEMPDFDCAANIGVCDSADNGRDYLSFPMCKKIGNKYYIYDWLFARDPMATTEHLVRGKIIANGLHNVRFESNNGGKLFAKNVADGCKGCSVTWKTTTQNKEIRILNDSEWIKRNMVFRKQRTDKDGYPIQDDYSNAIKQVLCFIRGTENRNQKDDAPDSLSMLRRFIEELGLNHVNRVDDREAWESVPVSLSNLRV